MDKTTAWQIYHELRRASCGILDLLHVQRDPLLPVNRTRPWASRGPVGIAYHYTGGPSAEKSLRWFNDERWQNKTSAAHVLVHDVLADDLVGEAWLRLDKALLDLFPVPTIVLADWGRGTWCTNWGNAYCIGVENRNVGYNVAPYGKFAVASGRGVAANGQLWEQYTREQLVSNLSLGRLVAGIAEDTFNPWWVVGHSMIWATKRDPGPLFPLHAIRKAISRDGFDGFLDAYPRDGVAAAPPEQNLSAWWTPSASNRGDEAGWWSWEPGDPGDDPSDVPELINVARDLHTMGWPKSLGEEEIRWTVAKFQHSTAAYGADDCGHHEKVLKVDGIAGPRTLKAIKTRLEELGYEH
jgi:N-acetyl-anhydromuramyl-L-alanine amidase AmpD